MARDARDAGGEAHSVELQGTALAMRDQLAAAVRRWQHARTIFAGVGEDAGESRCLLNLGAAAHADPRMAGLLRDGRPTPLSRRAAAEVAYERLERARALRTGKGDTALVDHYLSLVRRDLTGGSAG